MLTIYYSLKEMIRNNDFVRLNQMLENPGVIPTLHLDNNYVLREVVKKGILSSVKKVLKNNIVWLNFDEDELLRLSRQYSPHKGIQRLIEKAALDRFEHYLRNTTDTEGFLDVHKQLDRSAFIKAHAAQGNNIFLKLAIKNGSLSLVKALLKNNAVADQCGLSELYLALKYSNHPGIVRELLNNKEVNRLVMDEIEEIDEALQQNDFSYLVDELQCFNGFSDELALSKNTIDEEIEESESSEEELEDYAEESESSEEELEDYEEEQANAEASETDSQEDAEIQDDFKHRRNPSPLACYSLFTKAPSPTNESDDELAESLERLYGNV